MDIIAEMVAHLEAELLVPVSSEAPQRVPDKFVLVRRAGGGGDRFVDNPRINLHCWAPTDYGAAALAYDAATAALAGPDHITNLAAISQDSIYQNDLDGRHRWTVSLVGVCNR